MSNYRKSRNIYQGHKLSLLAGSLLLGFSAMMTPPVVKPAVAQRSCSLPNAQIEQGEVNGEEVNVSVSRWAQGSCLVFYTNPSPIQLHIQLGWDSNCSGSSYGECGKMYARIDGEEAEYLGRYEGYRSGYRVRDRWGTEYQFITYDPSAANAPSNSISRDISGENVILNQSGSLSSSDNQRDDGQRMDVYGVELDRNQLIQIDVTSNDFDTVLLFANSNGDVIASNDDISRNNLNSRLSHSVSYAGRYLVGVSSYASSDRGLYQLRVTSLSNLGSRAVEEEHYIVGGSDYTLVVTGDVWRYVDQSGYYDEVYPISRLESPRDGVLFDGRTYFCRADSDPQALRGHHCTANGWEPY